MPKIKTIEISAKCRDQCYVSAQDADGALVADGDGYVPDFMPGVHYGDYIQLTIDVATGRITNWVVPKDRQILDDIKGV
jgi:hypothetical protein